MNLLQLPLPCSSNHTQVFEYLLTKGADPSLRSFPPPPPPSDPTEAAAVAEDAARLAVGLQVSRVLGLFCHTAVAGAALSHQ